MTSKSDKLKEINARYEAKQLDVLKKENYKLKSMLKELVDSIELASEEMRIKKLSKAKILLAKKEEDDDDDEDDVVEKKIEKKKPEGES